MLMLLYTLTGIGILYGSFSLLYRNNKARLLMLRKSFEQDKYTLSIRFQLEENMRAFELIRHGIWAHSVGSSLGMLLFCIPFIVPIGGEHASV
ncbi:unnamed protein product, partial [Mesorhabditis belari]|uniref:Uncharacterized protein n=1 Tax=Mesorhabditis belari TaxID=2138241 RepID=A0AAF3FKK6_9BILA